MLGHPDRATDVADVAFIGAAITIGALLGAFVYKAGSVPLTLSTSGGVLIAGLFFGWLRSVRPTFGRIPSPTVWFMNSVGLNMFIAVVESRRGRVCRRAATARISLFLWGVAVTTVPLILAMYWASTCSNSTMPSCWVLAPVHVPQQPRLGMINDRAKSRFPASVTR